MPIDPTRISALRLAMPEPPVRPSAPALPDPV
jgi:hypothetical protein